jgi:hypothetical protein
VLPTNPLTIKDVADVADFPDRYQSGVSCFRGSRRPGISWFTRFSMICQFLCSLCSLWLNISPKTSKMLPPVAAVLPAEKGNETLEKWGLLPCCRFSGPLSVHLAFLVILCGFGSLRLCVEVGKSAISAPPARPIVVNHSLTTCCGYLTVKNGEYFRLFPALQNERQNPRRILPHTL